MRQCNSLVLEHDVSCCNLIQASLFVAILHILLEFVEGQASQVVSWLKYLPSRIPLVLLVTKQHMLVGKALE